jgi:hypothetical protein
MTGNELFENVEPKDGDIVTDDMKIYYVLKKGEKILFSKDGPSDVANKMISHDFDINTPIWRKENGKYKKFETINILAKRFEKQIKN